VSGEREQLVQSFLEGGMSRRTLVRRLVAGGVSIGAAMSYAQLLNPERAGAAGTLAVTEELYPLVKVSIVSTDLDVVQTENRVRVSVTSTEEIGRALFRTYMEKLNGLDSLGRKFFSSAFLAGAGQRSLFVPVNGEKIGTRPQATIWVHLTASDLEGRESLAVANKQLQR
jgi:hypothetical protein